MSLSIDSIPELAEMPRGERWRIIGWCHLCSFLHWQTWAGLVLETVIAIACQIGMRFGVPSLTTRHAPLMGFSGAVAGWVIGGHLSWKIRVHVLRGLVRKRFPHVCQDCGYDLRASNGTCPECGLTSPRESRTMLPTGPDSSR